VQSSWPPNSDQSEPGLARLGTWKVRETRTVDTSRAPLTASGERIAHVALVYSHLEEQGPHPGSGFDAAGMAAVSLGHYASVVSLARMTFLDTWAMIEHHAPDAGEPAGSHSAPPLAWLPTSSFFLVSTLTTGCCAS